MTLVVARIYGDRIAIASDTLLTQQDHPLPIQRGVVKSCMLPGDICVSFSNSPELAQRDFEKFIVAHPDGAGFSETLTFFENSSLDTNNDYIVAFSRMPQLVKIVDGKRVRSIANTLWIGDKDAYTRFREYESKSRRGKESGRAIFTVLMADELPNSPASDLYSAMRHVVADPDITSAGGFVCLISNRDPGFRHSAYSDMLYNWPKGANEDHALSLTDQVDLGASGENTEFAISQISTGYLGLNYVAFYLLKGRKLYLFGDDGLRTASKCTVFSDVEPPAIVAKLKDTIGVDLHWRALITSSPKGESDTTYREKLLSEQPNGMGVSIYCHLNTMQVPRAESHELSLTLQPRSFTSRKPPSEASRD